MHSGKRVSNDKANSVIARFYNFAPESEQIIAIHKVIKFRPSTRLLIVTKNRILSAGSVTDTEGNIIFTKEILSEDIESVDMVEGKKGRIYDFLYFSKVIIRSKDDEFVLRVRSIEAEKIAETIKSIIGTKSPESIIPSQAIELARLGKLAAQKREESIRELSKLSSRKAGNQTSVKTFHGFSRGVAEKKAERYARRHNLKMVSMTKAVNGVLTVVFEK